MASDPLQTREEALAQEDESRTGFLKASWLAPAATALLVLVLGLNNLSWLAHSQVRYSYDFPIHAGDALDFWRHLVAGDLAGALRVSHYGPVGLLPAAALFSLRQPALELLNASQVLWLPLYAASLFFLGRRLYGPGAGFLACLYLFTLPLFASITKEYPLEVGSHALALLCAALLVASDFLRRRGASFWFGVTLALGAMTKPEFVAQWILPVAFLIVRISLRSSLSRTGKILALLGLALAGFSAPFAWLALRGPLLAIGRSDWFPLVAVAALLALVVLAAWTTRARPEGGQIGNALLAGTALMLTLLPYLCVRDLSAMLDERVRTALEGTLHGTTWFDPLYYLQVMAGRSFHWLHLALLGVGLALAAWRREDRDPGRGFILGMLVWTFVLVNAVSGKFEIYLANLLGFAAPLATGWASPYRPTRRVVAALLGVWGLFTVLGWALPEQMRPMPPFRHYVGAGIAPVSPTPNRPLPLLAELPHLHPPVMIPILEQAHARAQGQFLLWVLSAEGDVVHPSWFEAFARYRGIPARIPLDQGELRSWRIPPSVIGDSLPAFLVVSRKLNVQGSAAALVAWRRAFPGGPELQAEPLGTWFFEPGLGAELFRLRPTPGTRPPEPAAGSP